MVCEWCSPPAPPLPSRPMESTSRGGSRLETCPSELVSGGVAAAAETPSYPLLLRPLLGTIVEHCPAGFTLAASIAQRIAVDGGAALIIDYSSSAAGATVRGIAKQAFVDPLSAPGEVDLVRKIW